MSKILQKNKSCKPKDLQRHLVSLYIIRSDDGICLFSHHFQIGLNSQIETQLVGMGFTAILKMIKEIVDTSATVKFIDLGNKKIIIDERKHFSSFLVTTENSLLIREKISILTDCFEKLFELQRQINLKTCVCLEDYALTSDLVSFIFENQSVNVLDIIPIIFKSIQRDNSVLIEKNLKIMMNEH